MRIIANNYDAKDIFKFIRENTDLTQKEFGEKVSLKENTIHSYECGKRNYDFEFLLKIANIFNLKIIIKYKETRIIANNYKSNELIKIIREISGFTIKKFSKIIKKSIPAIYNYEYGNRNYDFKLLLEIAREFNLIIIIEN